MRVALELTPRNLAGDDAAAGVRRLVDLAREADGRGVDSLWLTEDPDGWDAFATLAHLAGVTERIRLGTGVTNPHFRHPNLIAASLATLDRLSGGRAFLGLGRGQAEWYRAVFGMAVDRPLARLRETVSLLRQWEQPPHVARSEGAIPVRNWKRTLAPQGRVPIYLAAAGPKTLALAGEVADGVRFNELAAPHYLEQAIKTARGATSDAGRDPSELRFFVHPSVTVTANEASIERVLERKKGTIALIHALPGMEQQLETPGFDLERIMAEVRTAMRTEQVLAQGGAFAELRTAGDFAAAKRAIPMELIDRVAIVGPAERVLDRLRELAGLGVTDVFLDLDQDMALAELIPTIEAM